MTKRVAIYARTSTDKNQTVENQLRQLTEVGLRLGWTIVAVHTDEGISGTKGRDRRPGFDVLMRGITRREYDLVAVWSICRLGRSLQDLVGFLAEVQARGVGIYCHSQALDSTTPSGRALFGMIAVFSEFERAMIRDRVLAGLERTKAKGTRLGRPPMSAEKFQAIQELLLLGTGIRETARRTGAGTSSVQRIRASMMIEQETEAAA